MSKSHSGLQGFRRICCRAFFNNTWWLLQDRWCYLWDPRPRIYCWCDFNQLELQGVKRLITDELSMLPDLALLNLAENEQISKIWNPFIWTTTRILRGLSPRLLVTWPKESFHWSISVAIINTEKISHSLEYSRVTKTLAIENSPQCKLSFFIIRSTANIGVKVSQVTIECFAALAALKEMVGTVTNLEIYNANIDPRASCKDKIGWDGNSVVAIDWSGKGLKGSISTYLQKLPKVTKLVLKNDALTGSYPEFLATGRIVYLDLSFKS